MPLPSDSLIVRRGARAAEGALFERLDELAAEAAAEPALLARPVWVVVPSKSLRDHLAAALVRRRGRSLAGVAVVTLYAAALEVLARAGEAPPRGAVALEVLARRFAQGMPTLSRSLAGLADGFGVVVGSVRDLLDAGFTEDHLEAAGEQLAELGRSTATPRGQLERADELLRVAAACHRAMPELGVGRPADAYARAAALLRSDPDRLAARAVLVHGFADATGLALDFLEALLAARQGALVLDLPPDPATPGGAGEGAGVAFADRLARRLAGRPAMELAAAAPASAGAHAAAAQPLALVAATALHAEAREVAARVRRLLEDGARPEGIGVVARDPGPYRLPLANALRRLGVPFSAPGLTGSPGAAERRLLALAVLLARGGRAPADRWLEAARPAGGGGRAIDLRLGLRTLGAARLADVAELEAAEVLGVTDALPLPVRRGGRGEAEERDGPRRGWRRRRLSGEVLRRAIEAARHLLEHLEAWPARASLAAHLAHARVLLARHLRLSPVDGGAGSAAWAALATLGEDLPGEVTLAAEEAALLLRRGLERAAGRPLGGAGGGIQVLSVVEARGRTFEHLFVLGLNRDLFPRPVKEDALLPDALRRALAAVLPDVPVKAAGHAEERYYFAQLLSAAGRVTLSWAASDDDGLPRVRSPLVDRLTLARPGLGAPVAATHPFVPGASPPARPLPAHEEATRAGLAGGAAAFARLLPAALVEARCEAPLEVARARVAALAEIDPPLVAATARRLGPFLGLVGPRPPAPATWITALERLAACPWQTYLRRELRLEPPPDPLGALSGLDARLVGIAVHEVLERVVARSTGEEAPRQLSEALARSPVALAWPPIGELAALVADSCRRVTRDEGVPLLARALASRVAPFVEVAAASGLGEGASVYGAELEGGLEIETPGGPRRIAFRADLAEAVGDEVRLTDFKTGKPISTAKTATWQRRHLLGKVRRGSHLQAVAYALAEPGAIGRYLFLGPDREAPAREFAAAPDGEGFAELREGFAATVEVLLAAFEAGACPPRLLDAKLEKRGPSCAFCEVFEACAQHDSGSTRRLARWLTAERRAAAGGPPATATLAGHAAAVLRLHDKEEGR